MDDDAVKRAAHSARRELFSVFPLAEPLRNQDAIRLRNQARHVMWMLDQVHVFVDEGRKEKAMRWLGFAQGFLWTAGLTSIAELKSHNRPVGQDNGTD